VCKCVLPPGDNPIAVNKYIIIIIIIILSGWLIQLYVLISQNTTILAQMVHKVSTMSTTCFGLYIGHGQVQFNLSSNFTICVVYSGRGNEILSTTTSLIMPTSPIDSTPQQYCRLEVNNTPSYQDIKHSAMEPTSYPYATLRAEATVDCNML
jgi:hypothetical protein